MLSVFLNLYLIIKLIDTGVSIDHQSMELKSEINDSNEEFELLSLLLKGSVTRQEIIDISNKLSVKGIVIKNRENFLQIGRLEISFSGDEIDNVKRF